MNLPELDWRADLRLLRWTAALIFSACATVSAPTARDAGPPRPTDAPAPASKVEPRPAGKAEEEEEEEKEPSVAIELDEGTYIFDRDGRLETRMHSRAKILRPSGIEAWSSLEASWSPWFQDRPELRAQVVQPDGTRQDLDPRTIEESGIGGSDPTMYQDRREIRAPLPGVQVGSVVDFEIITKDREPYFVGGQLGRFYFDSSVRLEMSRLEVRHPVDVPLSLRLKALELRPEESVQDGVRRVVYAAGPREPSDSTESLVPPDQWAISRASFSVGGNWQKIAAAYAEVVDRQIASAALPNLLSAAGNERQPRAIAERLLAEIHRRVRYTGLELGDAAIIPATPSEVLKRGYGDCKDKATLLVAALRAKGIPATVALVNVGAYDDVEPTTPALSAFDHAIVHVPGPDPLWIDATVDTLAAGQIPMELQGRHALIADARSTELVEIPTLPDRVNVYRSIREITLPAFGPAEVNETIEGEGSMARRLRQRYRDRSAKELKETLGSYLTSVYGDGEITAVTTAKDSSSAGPYAVRLAGMGLQRAQTLDWDAAVQLSSSALFSWLPMTVRDDVEGRKPRRGDLLLPEPYVAEVIYRIKPPLGFELRSPPPDREQRLGPATWRRTTTVKDGLIEVYQRLESGPRRWSAADVEACRLAADAMENDPLLLFDHQGARLQAEGRTKEALDVYRGVARAEPKVAIHQARLAHALASAGFGAPARTAARRGVELEPGSFYAQFFLAQTLAADLFGRLHQPGMDRAGAIAAYQRAKALAPKNLHVRQNLAITYEQSPDAIRYGEGSQLDLAIAEYRGIQKDLNDHSLDVNLSLALLFAGRPQEAEQAARAAPAGGPRNGALFVAVALQRGAAAAQREVDALGISVADRRAAASSALQTLLALAQYRIASEVAELTAKGEGALSESANLEWVRRLRTSQESMAAAPPAALPVMKLIALLLVDLASERALLELFSSESRAELERERRLRKREGNEAELSQVLRAGLKAALPQRGQPKLLLNLALSLTEFQVDGSAEGGLRVRMSSTTGGVPNMETYLVVEQGQHRIRASRGLPASLGAEALTRLRRGDRAGAEQWLAWAREALGVRPGETGPDLPPALRLGEDWPSEDQAKLELKSAAVMASGPGTALAALPPLLAAAKAHPEDPTLMLVLAQAHGSLGRWPEMERYATAASKAGPDSAAAFALRCAALDQAGRYQELRSLAEERLRAHPEDEDASKRLERVLAERLADFPAWRAAIDRRLTRETPHPIDYNERAWGALFGEFPPEATLADALKAASGTRFSAPGILHTLGCIYAEQEKPAEATKVLMEILRIKGEPDSVDWFIVGRIAESYGLKEGAIDAYKKVERDPEDRKNTTWYLAARRLKGLLAGR